MAIVLGCCVRWSSWSDCKLLSEPLLDIHLRLSNAFLIQLTKFALTVVGSIVLKYLGTYLLEHHVGIDYKIGKLIADLFVSVLFNYPLQRFWVFHKTRP